jgi:hypothetical protein
MQQNRVRRVQIDGAANDLQGEVQPSLLGLLPSSASCSVQSAHEGPGRVAGSWRVSVQRIPGPPSAAERNAGGNALTEEDERVLHRNK